jgi:hypothetical protein
MSRSRFEGEAFGVPVPGGGRAAASTLQTIRTASAIPRTGLDQSGGWLEHFDAGIDCP